MAPNPEPESEKDPFLDHLRQRFSDEQVLPSPELWAALSPRLPAPNPWLTRYVGGGTGVGLLLGILLGWLIGLPGEKASVSTPSRVAPVTVTTSVTRPVPANAKVVASPPPATEAPVRSMVKASPTGLPARPAPLASQPSVPSRSTRVAPVAAPAPVAAATVSAPPKAPVFLLPGLWHSALALDSAIRQETASAAGAGVGPDADHEVRLAALLAAQQPVLLALQNHLDSLRATAHTAQPSVPAGLTRADSVARLSPPAAAGDTVRPSSVAPPKRWSALLLSEATTRWGELPGYHAATTREQLVSARTQAVAVEYRVPDATGTPGRWRLRAGVGETRLRDQFRFAADTVHHLEEHDTTWALTSTVRIRRDSTFTVRPDSIGRPEPIINAQGQIIGYQTVYEHFVDTTYYVTTRHDTTWRMTGERADAFQHPNRAAAAGSAAQLPVLDDPPGRAVRCVAAPPLERGRERGRAGAGVPGRQPTDPRCRYQDVLPAAYRDARRSFPSRQSGGQYGPRRPLPSLRPAVGAGRGAGARVGRGAAPHRRTAALDDGRATRPSLGTREIARG